MSRLLRSWVLWGGLFLVLLLSSGWAELNGFVSDANTNLWARIIIQVDGPSSYQVSDAFYPPIPFVLGLLTYLATGISSVPTTFLLAAAIAAAQLVLWYDSLRSNGSFGRASSLAILVLLGANPFFLRAVADGPETMLTMLGTWVFARGLVNLRLTGNAPDMMKVAVGLMATSLSSSYGLMICLGALPFMIVAARPSMVATSSFGYLFAMFYPVLASIGSLLAVAAIFDSNLVPLLVEDMVEQPAREHAWVLGSLIPATLIACLQNIRSGWLLFPLLAAVGSVIAAYVLNFGFHVESDPAVAAAPLLAVTVVALRLWPPHPARTAMVLSMLGASLLLSVPAIGKLQGVETASWVQAVQGRALADRQATLEVVAFTNKKSGIMVDVERNPSIVTMLGGVEQLIVAGQPLYDWPLEGAIPQVPYILVPAMEPGTVPRDRILLRFPELQRDRLDGYEEVFRNDGWLVFEKATS